MVFSFRKDEKKLREKYSSLLIKQTKLLDDRLLAIRKSIGKLRAYMRQLSTLIEDETKLIHENENYIVNDLQPKNDPKVLLHKREMQQKIAYVGKLVAHHNALTKVYRILYYVHSYMEVLLEDTKDLIKSKAISSDTKKTNADLLKQFLAVEKKTIEPFIKSDAFSSVKYEKFDYDLIKKFHSQFDIFESKVKNLLFY